MRAVELRQASLASQFLKQRGEVRLSVHTTDNLSTKSPLSLGRHGVCHQHSSTGIGVRKIRLIAPCIPFLLPRTASRWPHARSGIVVPGSKVFIQFKNQMSCKYPIALRPTKVLSDQLKNPYWGCPCIHSSAQKRSVFNIK